MKFPAGSARPHGRENGQGVLPAEALESGTSIPAALHQEPAGIEDKSVARALPSTQRGRGGDEAGEVNASRPSTARLPRAYVSRVMPRRQLDGFYFRVDLPDGHGRISNRVDETEAVVDRAARIVELAKKGYEVIYETGPGEQSARRAPFVNAATNRINP